MSQILLSCTSPVLDPMYLSGYGNSCALFSQDKDAHMYYSPNLENRIWRHTCIISSFMENHIRYFTMHGDSMMKS